MIFTQRNLSKIVVCKLSAILLRFGWNSVRSDTQCKSSQSRYRIASLFSGFTSEVDWGTVKQCITIGHSSTLYNDRMEAFIGNNRQSIAFYLKLLIDWHTQGNHHQNNKNISHRGIENIILTKLPPRWTYITQTHSNVLLTEGDLF